MRNDDFGRRKAEVEVEVEAEVKVEAKGKVEVKVKAEVEVEVEVKVLAGRKSEPLNAGRNFKFQMSKFKSRSSNLAARI